MDIYKNINFNKCTHSELTIYPDFRKISAKEAMQKDWYVGCKFYDPAWQYKYPKGFFWRKKGLAEFKTFKERKEAAKILCEEMQKALDNNYNPIPEVCNYQIDDIDSLCSPNISLIDALEFAFTEHKQNISGSYSASIKSNLNQVKKMIIKLGFDKLRIKDTELKHIKRVLDNCNLSANSYNKFKKHLSVLFKILCANSCLIQNPCEYIPLKMHIKKEIKILSDKQFDTIYKYVFDTHEWYANYIQIFYMSGCRSTELLALRKKDVDIEKQEFTITVKKRKNYTREVVIFPLLVTLKSRDFV